MLRRIRTSSEAFWPLDEAIVVAYLFVVMFGAVRPGEILPVTIGTGALLIAWLAHAWLTRAR